MSRYLVACDAGGTMTDAQEFVDKTPDAIRGGSDSPGGRRAR
jgi:hypothetical protein